MNLNDYITLGRSGLKVSPLCLGTMSFGTEWAWGNDEATSKAIFDHYLDAGGNFIDTADLYTNGRSEQFVGKFINDRKARDKAVLATKFTFNPEPGNPNAGGNGRKNIYRALEGSLKRLGTDYIDLYWMHVWDLVTPVGEVVDTLHDLVQAGKIRYAGFSDVPAWYAARAQTLAEKEGKHRIVAQQLEYSLVERHIEREHVHAARELGMGICPWSPLAGGFLTGRHTRTGPASSIRHEQARTSGNPVVDKYSEHNWKIVDTLVEVAKEIGRPPAEVALNWVVSQPGITSTIIGVSKLEQLKSNLDSLSFTIPDALLNKLEDVSKLGVAHPYIFFGEFIQNNVRGGANVKAWKA
jgi:aryl-alcohol dehydrogenase-like predicted oxidoreductase